MISEKKYYDFLYENFLVKNKEQWEKANLWCENHTFCKMDEETEKLLELLCIWRIPTAGFAEQNGRNAKLNGRITFDY